MSWRTQGGQAGRAVSWPERGAGHQAAHVVHMSAAGLLLLPCVPLLLPCVPLRSWGSRLGHAGGSPYVARAAEALPAGEQCTSHGDERLHSSSGQSRHELCSLHQQRGRSGRSAGEQGAAGWCMDPAVPGSASVSLQQACIACQQAECLQAVQGQYKNRTGAVQEQAMH